MITDGKTTVGFPDWSRSGICDFLLDFVIMDLNKPYLNIPELLFEYCKKGILSYRILKNDFYVWRITRESMFCGGMRRSMT